jgi:hypothetical protein
VARQLRQKRAPQRLKNLLTGIGVLILAACGVAFWPTRIGAGSGDARQGRAVAAKCEDLAVQLKTRGTVTRSVTEKDLNGYFAYVMLYKAEEKARKKETRKGSEDDEDDKDGRRKKKKIDAKPDAAVFANIAEDAFQFQVRKSYGPLVVGKYQTPRWHLEYTISGNSEEGRLRATRASLGHVPFPIPFRAILVSAAKRRVRAGFKHETIFDNIAEVTLEDNRVRFTLKR